MELEALIDTFEGWTPEEKALLKRLIKNIPGIRDRVIEIQNRIEGNDPNYPPGVLIESLKSDLRAYSEVSGL